MKYPIGDDTNIWKWVPCELLLQTFDFSLAFAYFVS